MVRIVRRFIPVIVIAATIFGAYLLYSNNVGKDVSSQRVDFLVDELTTTAERQQNALDELVEGGDNTAILLFPYLNDKRVLATSNVKFLNRAPVHSEKYFMTLANSVDELTLRYLCWNMMVCNPAYDEKNLEDRKVQLKKLSAGCLNRFRDAQRCTLVE